MKRKLEKTVFDTFFSKLTGSMSRKELFAKTYHFQSTLWRASELNQPESKIFPPSASLYVRFLVQL